MRGWMATKSVLVIAVVFVTATAGLYFSRGSRLRLMMGFDREIPNAEFVTMTAALGPHLTEKDVEAILARYPMLHYARSGADRVASVTTPPQWDARNWIGWIEFGRDGRLLAARYGFVDHLLAKPEQHGLPQNACWGTEQECKVASIS